MDAFLRQAGVDGVGARDFLTCVSRGGPAPWPCRAGRIGWPLVSLATVAIGALMPLAYLMPRRERRRDLVQLALVDLASQLRAAIQAG